MGWFDRMIAESTVLFVLKGTLTTVGSAWLVAIVQGAWFAAVVAAPAMLLCVKETLRISRRQRGKRAERSP